MPANPDIKSVLLIGAGPIIIGQACEFDYSGTQACQSLRKEGVKVVLLNSNPATIMTDPDMADATYIAPITPAVVERILEKEKPDAILPTMGGQTALNCALKLHSSGALERNKTRLIGADIKSILAAEDRDEFRKLMQKIGLEVARSARAHSLAEANAALEEIGGLPAVVRPSFTLGGNGGGIAYNNEDFTNICLHGLALSPIGSLLIEESLYGWKEFELEVVRDCADNCIVVCGIENIDPLGVHTGDSATVAPIQTLTDKEYQRMRDASFKVLRAVGVDTGGANVQFAVNPRSGQQLVIEMNPRVSRSSALASKATGFPIAKISAKLALGYTLDELKNDITGGRTPASFEPTIDYVVCKLPRFTFDKFPGTSPLLGTQMRSVGEVMAFGSTFAEAYQKALRSLEEGFGGLTPQTANAEEALTRLGSPAPNSLMLVADALRHGVSTEKLHKLTAIDPWFIGEIEWLIHAENCLHGRQLSSLGAAELREFKRAGFSDQRLAELLGCDEKKVRDRRSDEKIVPVYKRVDSCAAEFPTETAYMYSTYGQECEAKPTERKKIMILGSGPNRIGQGIEFDYCCIHAAIALRDQGFETIMVNCNPETVSTDYDISDRLYFEPLTVEDILEIVRVERPNGVIVHYGGQTPLSIARQLADAGVPIIGTPVDAIDRAENRNNFREILRSLNLSQPANKVAYNAAEGVLIGSEIGHPLVVRPSYVLGGRAMEVVHTPEQLKKYLAKQGEAALARGVLLERFLSDATEVDVDAVCDGKDTVIAGVLEHIEPAGVHSGDSACSMPPHSLSTETIAELKRQTRVLARELGTIGLINVQFAIQNGNIYVLEVNPRAARTIPFVSKATGYPAAQIGALAMAGVSLAEQGKLAEPCAKCWNVKDAVFPFDKMPGAAIILGPEMKSTGEVMGIGKSFSSAFLRAITPHMGSLPSSGTVLLSVRDKDKDLAVTVAKNLAGANFELAATAGTAARLNEAKLKVLKVNKVKDGRPHVLDLIKNGSVTIVVNTVSDNSSTIADALAIRATALARKVLYFTTIDGALAAAEGLSTMRGTLAEPFLSLQQLLGPTSAHAGRKNFTDHPRQKASGGRA